jgi:hypothetical protein
VAPRHALRNVRSARVQRFCLDTYFIRLERRRSSSVLADDGTVNLGTSPAANGRSGWSPAATDAELSRTFDPIDHRQGYELLRYLSGLGRSDEMLQILMNGLDRQEHDGVLAFYGDHLPSLPHAFRHFGFDEEGSDYVLWRGDASPARRLDLPAHGLTGMIIDALHARGAIGGRCASAGVPAATPAPGGRPIVAPTPVAGPSGAPASG